MTVKLVLIIRSKKENQSVMPAIKHHQANIKGSKDFTGTKKYGSVIERLE